MFDIHEDSGIEYARELLAFAIAVLGADVPALNVARHTLLDCMGEDALVSAAATAAMFSLVDRAANGVGIFVEPMVLEPSEDFREQFGINQFPSAANTLGQALDYQGNQRSS